MYSKDEVQDEVLFMAPNTSIFKFALKHCFYRLRYHVGFNGAGSRYRCVAHFLLVCLTDVLRSRQTEPARLRPARLM